MIRTNQLGKTDLKISVLGLGTVALGMAYGITPQAGQAQNSSDGMNPPTLSEATQLIHKAIDGGITFIDTARGYGRSEEVLGHALQGYRDKVVLASKMGIHDGDGNELKGAVLRQHMQTSLEASLRLLHTDHIDLMMLHSTPDDYSEAVGILKEFRQQGHIRAIGASTYGTEDPVRAIESGIDALQIAYNVLDQRLADVVFPLAAEKGVGIVVRSVFLKGALTPRSADLPPHLAELKAQADAVKQFGKSLTPSLNQIETALRFVLSNPLVTTTLVGVRTEDELETSLGIAEKEPFPAELIRQFDRLRWDHAKLLNPGNWG
ncbi:MAG: aryl-alcohol dehydrogenase-like predicted oxidoreductase [Cellvibrionaceae bacterium]|jgi:aryl-alcohol dehydrogenase-like predicted oxidoreductase